jgi:hypothetical protein
MPASDADGHELVSTYYVDNQVLSQKQVEETESHKLNEKTIKYTYDPTGRTLETLTENTEPKLTSTVISHYAGSGDVLTWTSEGTEKWKRNIPGIDGQTYTLVTTTGAIVGTFGNAGEDAEVPIEFPQDCTVGAQTLRIEYHRSGGTQTVTGKVIAGPTSTTTLEASPQAPVTNQSVTLTATVNTSAETPAGTVQFDNGGTVIPGCASEPVTATISGYAATCHTSFATTTATVQFKLNTTGRALLNTDHGRLAAALAILETAPGPEHTQTANVHLTLQKSHGKAKK